jgi:hypothetical protein
LERGESQGQPRTLEAIEAALVAGGIEFHVAPDGSREGIFHLRSPRPGRRAMTAGRNASKS